MRILIACGSMPFGPNTPSCRSLGGSETAALMLAKALGARGNDVVMFCNLPPAGAPDHVPSGTKQDEVRWVDLSQYQTFAQVNECDLLIAVRDPGLVAIPAQAKKKVLWAHDIFTKRGMKNALEQMQFTFDEIWTVSEWHRAQVIEATGYPEERVIALRNGIVEYDDIMDMPRSPTQLVYASRPERGLENLIRPGGIMERLPEYTLIVAMYEHFPEHMRPYYEKIHAWMQRLPNVRFIGGQSNHTLRQIIRESAAYIYPTQFEETSCILARECIEQQTPFLTTSIGALPETLGDCGTYFEDWLHASGIVEPARGGDGWCMLFAQFFRETMQNENELRRARAAMAARDDLGWGGVAEIVEEHSEGAGVTDFSRLYSLIQDGDVIPAIALYDHLRTRKLRPSPAFKAIARELVDCYSFINGDIGKYYDDFYREKAKTDRTELVFKFDAIGGRYQAIADEVAKLPPGSRVFEYGCGPGHVLAPLAKAFPHIEFTGYDFSDAAVVVVNNGAQEHGLTNLVGVHKAPPDACADFDLVYCTEVLEHVVEPWKLLETVEGLCKVGGRVVLTVPFGGWEPESYASTASRWKERFHLWEIDLRMLKDMVGERPNPNISLLVAATTEWLRPVGNTVFAFDATHEPIKPVDALAKALRHRSRETCAAAIIAYNNEDTILRLLNSLDRKVQYVQIAHGPSTDKTRQIIDEWAAAHPWTPVRVLDVPKIEAGKFGFDDARNASITDLDLDFEWFLWIDTDEYLVGETRKYYRNSAIDGYLISQHHFTVEPRGVPAEIDRPARLLRLDRWYEAFGHIHEHFELVDQSSAKHQGRGPGRCVLLPDVDIGHPGYVNEAVRQARFHRNLPFLHWDHEDNPDRKLHKFLWLRDLIHTMRFERDEKKRRALAEEARSWYNEHRADMATFGPGMFMALRYLAEAHDVLGIGIPLKVTVTLDDRNAALEGKFESYEQLEGVLGQLLRDEFKERTSRYY